MGQLLTLLKICLQLSQLHFILNTQQDQLNLHHHKIRLGLNVVSQASPFHSTEPVAFSMLYVDTESDQCCGKERVWFARLG